MAYSYFGKTAKDICEIMNFGQAKVGVVNEVIKKNAELLKSTADIVDLVIVLFISGKSTMTNIIEGMKNSFNVELSENDIVPMIYEKVSYILKEKLKGEFNSYYMKIGSRYEAEKAFKKMCIDISKMSL